MDLYELWLAQRKDEGEHVRRALEAADWSLSGASRELGCPISTLARVLERHPELDAERQAKRSKAA